MYAVKPQKSNTIQNMQPNTQDMSPLQMPIQVNSVCNTNLPKSNSDELGNLSHSLLMQSSDKSTILGGKQNRDKVKKADLSTKMDSVKHGDTSKCSSKWDQFRSLVLNICSRKITKFQKTVLLGISTAVIFTGIGIMASVLGAGITFNPALLLIIIPLIILWGDVVQGK